MFNLFFYVIKLNHENYDYFCDESFAQICPGFPGHNPEDVVVSFLQELISRNILNISGKSVIYHFWKYSEYFGNYIRNTSEKKNGLEWCFC